ncbi:hypothetical protein ACP4OV_005019 [Aristida adscensionis]
MLGAWWRCHSGNGAARRTAARSSTLVTLVAAPLAASPPRAVEVLSPIPVHLRRSTCCSRVKMAAAATRRVGFRAGRREESGLSCVRGASGDLPPEANGWVTRRPCSSRAGRSRCSGPPPAGLAAACDGGIELRPMMQLAAPVVVMYMINNLTSMSTQIFLGHLGNLELTFASLGNIGIQISPTALCVGDFFLSKIKGNTLVSGGITGNLPWMAPEYSMEAAIRCLRREDCKPYIDEEEPGNNVGPQILHSAQRLLR